MLVEFLKIKNIILFFLFFICIVFLQNPAIFHKKIYPVLPKLEIGDLIFRQGIGADSYFIELLQEHIYSHVGIITSINPILITHAATGENSKENFVQVTDLNDFLSKANKIAIKRYELNDIQKANIILEAKKFVGKEFVLSPDEDNLYCTTFIYQILQPILNENLSYTYLQIPFFSGEYLLPKTLFNHSKSKLVFKTDL